MADLFGIAEGVLGKIASLALQEAVDIYGVGDQISELRETLDDVKAVLSDAEEQQTKNRLLQLWLDRLQDVLYDAEDVFDELECEALRKKVISRYGDFKGKVHRFCSLSNPLIFRAKISRRIKKIRQRLSKISTDKDQFGLLPNADKKKASTRPREITDSFVKKSSVVGRDIDKEQIIEMFSSPVDDKNISVIPIVGTGGLGKTTLAKLVYNDDRVRDQFKLLMWVCVPEDFDLKKIIENIIKHATGQSLNNPDIEQLKAQLRDTIKDKKYLLVLDDVWSNDRRKWKNLRDLLSEGASESKIIVTTRSLEVASIMGTHSAHNLEGLSHEDSMALFNKCAFDFKGKQPHPELLEIAEDIVTKCQGVPLLVETLGSLLSSKDDDGYWKRIRDSETWELAEAKKDIMPIVMLSYADLPSHLKRCFLILSLFPRGISIDGGTFARLCVALGLISPTGEKLALVDVAVEYVKELWSRSLIQEVEERQSEVNFKVHDVVHSLATSVAQNYCSTIELDTPEISDRVRYVATPTALLEEIPNYDGVPPFLRKETSKRLRAIMTQYEIDDGVITRDFARTCITKCKHLRFLDLSYGSFEELPSSICNLKQLRSLDLSTNERLKKLPDSLCDLQSLLHLYLDGCSELGELPKKMKRLVSLTHLHVTTKQQSLEESGIQHLENLQFLGLEACENLRVLFEGPCRLTRLRELQIDDCEALVSVPFGEFISLEKLSIGSCPLMLIPEKMSSFPASLRVLSIIDCEQVMKLLRCVNESACTLDSFCISDCPNFKAIPKWLFNHKCLREIRLIRCPKLVSMPKGIRSLTALKALYIKDCGELSERCEPQCGKDWHKIAHISQVQVDAESSDDEDDEDDEEVTDDEDDEEATDDEDDGESIHDD